MSKDQDKKKAKQEQKQILPAKGKKKIKSTELTDADLEKVSGGISATGGGAGSGIKLQYKE